MLSKSLVVLTLSTVATNALQNLCYKVEYDFNATSGAYQSKQLLKPVSGFPTKHAMVTQQYCGGATAGQPIPHGNATCDNCKFDSKTDFASCSSETVCLEESGAAGINECEGTGYVNAGSMFYAYGFPQQKSSNNGYSKEGASDIFFVQDSEDNIYMVLSHDKPDLDDGTPFSDGGRISLYINSTGLGNETLVVQMDDPGTKSDHVCVNAPAGTIIENSKTGETCVPRYCSETYDKDYTGADCFAWDNEAGEGTVEWWYKEPNTDGLVLGPIPAWGFDITLDYTHVESLLHGDEQGINEFRLGSYGTAVGDDADMVFFNKAVEAPNDEIANKFKISGFTCDHYCFEAFGDAFGSSTASDTFGFKKTAVCGTTMEDVQIDSALYNTDVEAAEQEYAKALVKALKGAMKDFDEEHFCTPECGAAAMEMEQVCSGVEAEWATELVNDITAQMIKQYESCQKAAEKQKEKDAKDCEKNGGVNCDETNSASAAAVSVAALTLGAALL